MSKPKLIRPMRCNVEHLFGRWKGEEWKKGEAMLVPRAEYLRLKRIEAAGRLTIRENLHLADGDVCTLKVLRDALRKR